MPGLTVNVLLQDIKKLETEALIVGFFENIRPLANLAGELDWLLCGSLSNLIINHKLQGALGEVALLTSRGKVPASKIFLVGLGPLQTATMDSLRRAAQHAVSSAIQAGVKDMALECFSAPALSLDAVLQGILKGAADASKGEQQTVHLLAPGAAAYEQISKLMNSRSSGFSGQAHFDRAGETASTASNTDIRRI